MNKTSIITLIIAALTSVWTWRPQPKVEAPSESITRAQVLTASGEEVDARKVTQIRVITIDASSGAPTPFEVRQEKGRWVIPSHFNYPADGGTMVGETAGAVLNLPMGPLVTADRDAHADYGVLDPLSAQGKPGAGKRVTLSDAGGATLVDVIIGAPKSGTEVYFVRRAQEDKVYTAQVKPDAIKSTFQDWVETDLLKFAEADLREVVIRDYSVDEQSGRLNDRSTTSLTRASASDDWALKPARDGQTLKETVAQELTSEAAQLRLVGVRPYADAWLQERGFYIGRDPSGREQLFGNEGEVQLTTQDGLVYHLFFGEIALGDAVDQEAKQAQNKQAESKSMGASGGSHNRYMAVFVQYASELDQSLPAPEFAPAPAPVTAPASAPAPAGATPAPTPTPAPQPTTTAETPTNQSEIDQGITAGKERAQKAQERFQRFFYVVADASFKKLRPAQDSLYEPKKAAGAEGEVKGAGGAPTTPQLPPGLPPELLQQLQQQQKP